MAGVVNMRAMPPMIGMIHRVFVLMYLGSMLVAMLCLSLDVFVLMHRFVVMDLFTCCGCSMV
jgi:hypothetical protein